MLVYLHSVGKVGSHSGNNTIYINNICMAGVIILHAASRTVDIVHGYTKTKYGKAAVMHLIKEMQSST